MAETTNETTESDPSRMAQAYAGVWGTGGIFAPGTPYPPFTGDDEKPRVFDYQSGINLYMMPRAGYGQMPFGQLKNFADTSDAVRIVIEAVKREIRSLEWDIQKADPGDDNDYSADITMLRAFWKMPDGVTEFDGWCNAVLEDMLVYDAVSLWVDQDAGGNVLSVEQIDGATIRPLLDQRGRTPRPPAPWSPHWPVGWTPAPMRANGWCASRTAGSRLRWSPTLRVASSTISRASSNNGQAGAGP